MLGGGVDALGKSWAGDDIPVTMFPADRKRYKNSAGHRRNTEMAIYADALLAIWDGKSPGTRNMIGVSRNKGLKVYVFDVSKKINFESI